jgi:hypothetical protein
MTTPRWFTQAACRHTNTNLFILDADSYRRQHQPGTAQQINDARTICNRCPVQQACGDHYLQLTARGEHDAFAIAGGLTPWERQEIIRFRNQTGAA